MPEEKEPLDKVRFVREFNNQRLNLEKFQKSKYLIMAMVGVQSEDTVLEQQQAIKEFLGTELFEVENYIQQNLDTEKHFYIVEKGFWDKWSAKNNLPESQIDNLSLI